jgi:exo-beta-1,3-glucanase (GH17 family)
MPADYYSRILAHTGLPVVIAESGWPTGGDPAWHGSDANQTRFLTRVAELTQPLTLSLWIWWFLHDWAGAGYPAFFQTMGLRNSDGTTKPSWSTWQSIHG